MYSQAKADSLVRVISSKLTQREREYMLGPYILFTYRSLEEYCSSKNVPPTHEMVDEWLRHVRSQPIMIG